MQTDQLSASALNVARCRAIAAHDSREDIRGPDVLAEFFLDEAGRQSLRNKAAFPLILKKLDDLSPGTYEYFIGRTAYLDEVVKRHLHANIPQLVFLGAGYDTRTYRFGHLLRDTHVFELDNAATQDDKRAHLERAEVDIPKQLTFVPIDFNIDSLSDKLCGAGYRPDQRALFVWEGVTYYLPPPTVDETLAFVRSNSPSGSIICFDYMLPVTQLEGRFGAQQARAAMQAIYTNEPLGFDLDDSQVEKFLAKRGFELIEHLTAVDLQTRYLTLHDGTLAGHMLDLFCLVQARVVNS